MERRRRVQRLLSSLLGILSITLRHRGTRIPLPEVSKSRAVSDGGGSLLIMRVMTRLTRKFILEGYQTRSRCIWTPTVKKLTALMHGMLLFSASCLGSLSRPSYLTIDRKSTRLNSSHL